MRLSRNRLCCTRGASLYRMRTTGNLSFKLGRLVSNKVRPACSVSVGKFTFLGDHDGNFHWEVSWFADTNSSCAILCGRNGGNYSRWCTTGYLTGAADTNSLIDTLRSERAWDSVWPRTLSTRIFCLPSQEPSGEPILGFFSWHN